MNILTKQCGISLLAVAVWGLVGPVAKAEVVTDWNITAGDNPCRVSIQPA